MRGWIILNGEPVEAVIMESTARQHLVKVSSGIWWMRRADVYVTRGQVLTLMHSTLLQNLTHAQTELEIFINRYGPLS